MQVQRAIANLKQASRSLMRPALTVKVPVPMTTLGIVSWFKVPLAEGEIALAAVPWVADLE